MRKFCAKTVQKLIEYYFWQKLLKFYDEIHLLIRMTIIYNVRHNKIRKKILNFSDKVSVQRENLYLLYNQRKPTFILS